jgi:hypothetical protein
LAHNSLRRDGVLRKPKASFLASSESLMLAERSGISNAAFADSRT